MTYLTQALIWAVGPGVIVVVARITHARRKRGGSGAEK